MQMIFLAASLNLITGALYYWRNHQGLWLMWLSMICLALQVLFILLVPANACNLEAPLEKIITPQEVEAIPPYTQGMLHSKRRCWRLPFITTNRWLIKQLIKFSKRFSRWLYDKIETKWIEGFVEKIAALLFGFSYIFSRLQSMKEHHSFLLTIIIILLSSLVAIIDLTDGPSLINQ